MIRVDRETGIPGDCCRDRAAHPAVRSEEADPDRLIIGAHGALMAEGRTPRNGSPAFRTLLPVDKLLQQHFPAELAILGSFAALRVGLSGAGLQMGVDLLGASLILGGRGRAIGDRDQIEVGVTRALVY